MRTQTWLATIVFALSTYSGISGAAELSNAEGQSCGSYDGFWHFVNNQIPEEYKDKPAYLHAIFLRKDGYKVHCKVSAYKVNRHTQHFYCTAPGKLLAAYTYVSKYDYTKLPGRLVLSDYTCKKEYPTCDPYKDYNCDKEY